MNYRTDVTDTFGNYMIWSGMQYRTAEGGKGLFRLGDRLEWTDDSRGGGKMGFSVLASDEDTRYRIPQPESIYQVLASHPDRDGTLFFERFQAPALVLSRWASTVERERSPLDTNYAFTDGSVERHDRVTWDDARMARVPYDEVASRWAQRQVWVHVPKR